MSEAAVDYRIGLLEDLANPEEAAAYLNAALEDGDQEVFLLALRDVTEARGMTSTLRVKANSIGKTSTGFFPSRVIRSYRASRPCCTGLACVWRSK